MMTITRWLLRLMSILMLWTTSITIPASLSMTPSKMKWSREVMLEVKKSK